MKKYIFKALLGCATLTPAMATQPIEITQTNKNQTVLGKYKEYKEVREIVRNGKVVDKETINSNEDGLIYDFKSKDLVTVFLTDIDGKTAGVNFDIKRNKDKYELINKKGEAENDELLLIKNSPDEVIFTRTVEDGDEDGEILVHFTIYLKRIK